MVALILVQRQLDLLTISRLQRKQGPRVLILPTWDDEVRRQCYLKSHAALQMEFKTQCWCVRGY